MPHLYIYVWFPLVPHWDVLSIAWKCSKYRFWVCSNYFCWNPYLEHPRCEDFQIFSKVCSKCMSVAIYYMDFRDGRSSFPPCMIFYRGIWSLNIISRLFHSHCFKVKFDRHAELHALSIVQKHLIMKQHQIQSGNPQTELVEGREGWARCHYAEIYRSGQLEILQAALKEAKARERAIMEDCCSRVHSISCYFYPIHNKLRCFQAKYISVGFSSRIVSHQRLARRFERMLVFLGTWLSYQPCSAIHHDDDDNNNSNNNNKKKKKEEEKMELQA